MISTFCSTLPQVKAAVNAGADCLILEHSSVTVRSFYDDSLDPEFKKYEALSSLARSINPGIILIVSLDILAHNADFDGISQAVRAAVCCDINRFRVQDIGLVGLIRENCPNALVTFAPEIGHHSTDSIEIALKFAENVSVGNEVPFSSIQSVSKRSSLEVQVQGQILIQYSYRRYLDGLYGASLIYDQFAGDQEYPGRQYRFYDSPNGTVMFLYFDRCLLKESHLLKDLELSSWLVDCRGYSIAYLSHAVSVYRQILIGEEVDVDHAIKIFKELSGGRPQRPGFFLKNHTDQDRDRELDNSSILGTVKDSVKNKYTVIEFRENLDVFPKSLNIVSTKKVKKTLPWPEFKDYSTSKPVNSAKVGDLLLCHWIPGVSAKSVVITH